MGEARSTYGEEEILIWRFGGETWGKEPLGRTRNTWEKNIKMDLKNVG
jgi:hypothetical protein